ncbi:hypothetical protein SY88_08790 [Clostridiales bacterium PH28_bin88]|nr:hypothetical protein SY88_08790 [Clostridiales bacterium PH28_bin88]
MSFWRKISLLLLTALLLCAPAGCWSRREINEVAFVMALGLDFVPGGPYRVTVQVARAEAFSKEAGGSPREKGFEVYTAMGTTPAEAVRNLSRQLPRRLLLSHCRIILIDERLAVAGVEPVLDFFQRNHEFRETAWILVTRGEAHDLLKKEVNMQNIPAETISRLMKYSEETSRGHAVTIKDFLQNLITPGVDPVAASVEVLPGPAQGGKPKARLDGVAVFKGDRLVGWLDDKETRGFLWAVGEAGSGVIVVDAPGDRGKVAFEFLRARRKITPEIRDGRLMIRLEIDTEGILADLDNTRMASGRGITARELAGVIEGIEDNVEAAIKDEVRAALLKAQQEYLADIFGFGRAIRRRFPREWRTVAARWDEIYPFVEVQVEVDARLRESGFTRILRW